MPRLILHSLLLVCFTLAPLRAADLESLKSQAETQYDQKSYAKAHDLYLEISKLKLTPTEEKWVAFRLADTEWRSQSSTSQVDSSKLDAARIELEKMVRDVTREDQKDLLWVEVQESLGDFYWFNPQNHNWGGSWPYYNNALQWWGASTDLDLARKRYLDIVWKCARPPTAEPYYRYGNYGNYLPVPILENAYRIAQSKEDKAHATYLLASGLRYQGQSSQRVRKLHEEAIENGRNTDWYDDVLFQYAQWLTQQGKTIITREGARIQQPDYVQALVYFQRIVDEFKKGETSYYDEARQQIKEINRVQLNLQISNAFLPNTLPEISVNWKNVGSIEWSVYPVELIEDFQPEGSNRPNRDFMNGFSLTGKKPIQTWTYDTQDTHEHLPGQATLKLKEPLKSGAYVVVAQSGQRKTSELLMVTDAVLVSKSAGDQSIVYYCDARDGSPIPNAQIKVWEVDTNTSPNRWISHNATTGSDGIASLDFPRNRQGQQIYLFAKSQDRQAVVLTQRGWQRDPDDQWKIYAYTDRPAYRPEEVVQWKWVVRQSNGSVYGTPGEESMDYEIQDPQGNKIEAATCKLNSFGSAWGSFKLKSDSPLGSYTVQFWTPGRKRNIGSAELFRMEEYKLPEYKVSVETPRKGDRKKIYRLGDTVEAEITAEYYFGGPVANATVQLVVRQNPYAPVWYPHRDYPWFYDQIQPWGRPYYGGYGQIIKQETLKTNAEGKARIQFDTPEGNLSGLEYQIEARVTDSSRREVVGQSTVRVTPQSYSVHPEAAHNLYQPRDKVKVTFKSQDANDQPVAVTGKVHVTRERWYEIWLDPDGNEVKGPPLQVLREKSAIFPPPPVPGKPGWSLKFRGYEHDDVLTQTVKTNKEGEGELSFQPDKEGYYQVSWMSEDRGGPPVQAQTTVWVADASTRSIGYHTGGVELIVDKDTFRAGQVAPIMISVPASDRYVLFTIEGENLYHRELVHVEGTVKLLQIPIEEKHVPNVFLTATMVSDYEMHTQTQAIVVPPVKNFLKVDIQPEKSQYEVREKGKWTLTATDVDGKPVSAELSFGIVDESIYSIQESLAGDPKKFFYGEKREQWTQTGASVMNRPFARSRGTENDRSEDEKLADKDGSSRRDGGMAYGNEVRAFGAVGGAMRMKKAEGMAMDAPMPASAPMMAKEMAADSLESKSMAQNAVAGSGGEAAVVVRSDFRSTMFWQPDLKTDKNGKATVEVTYPDSLTTWKANVIAVTDGNQFGDGTGNVKTTQPLIARLQAPRFFTEGDEVVLSAVINNHTDTEMTVTPELKAEGILLLSSAAAKKVTVPAGKEQRVDWKAHAASPGQVKLTLSARSGKYSDAMEKKYEIFEHGIEKFIAKSGKTRGDTTTVLLDLPSERRKESTQLSIQVTPSLAVTMLDALPYLIQYPYGCTEQTMSRFLPTVIVSRTLKDLGLNPEHALDRAFGGIEAESALKTHPKGKHSLDQLDAMTRQGLERLANFQHGDGGWGWWKECSSDHFMSAYVVWGLSLAQAAGTDIDASMLSRGADYLHKELVEEENAPDMQAWMLHALSEYHQTTHRQTVGNFEKKAINNLWKQRENLNAYTRALFAIACHHFGDAEKASTLIDNLENGVIRDTRPDQSILLGKTHDSDKETLATAHWGQDGIFWRWSDGSVEATAFALKALMTIRPDDKLVEPVSNWLLKNRRGAQWSNTRDTAIVLLAMTDYLKKSGELSQGAEYELLINGKSLTKENLSKDEILQAPARFTAPTAQLQDGRNEIQIRSKGAPLYFSVNATYFSLEEPITAAGNEIFVKRQYFRKISKPTLLNGYQTESRLLENGETVKSGDRIEVVLTVEAKNHYEYLLFEDLKPAGFEAVQIKSGEPLYAQQLRSDALDRLHGTPKADPQGSSSSASTETPLGRIKGMKRRPPTQIASPSGGDIQNQTGESRLVYQELRDRKVSLFLDKLPEGVWEIRYELRAETPGAFHGLPVLGHAMYVPEIRCNSDEIRVRVSDE